MCLCVSVCVCVERERVRVSDKEKLSQLMQDEFGETALIAASHQGHLSTAALLLDHGADVNKQNKVRLFVCP